MKFIDLFAGIGGFRTGMELNGHECVAFCEIDKHARKSYKAMFDTIKEKEIHDIKEWNNDQIKEFLNEVGTVECLTGGFPCQSFSVAGKRGGFEDTRGTLFFEIIRIAEIIKPEIMLLENVKGLVGHDKGRTLDTIVKTLNDTGYRVDFEVLNSKYFDVPQNRERIFIVAVHEDLINNEPWNIEGNKVVAKGKKRISKYDDVKTFNFNFPKNNKITKKLSDVLENQVEEAYYLDENKTSQLISQSFNDDINNMGLPIKQATKQGYVVAHEGDSVNISFPNSKTRRGRVGKDSQAQTLEAGGVNQGVVVKNKSYSGLYLNDSKRFFRKPMEELSRTLKGNKHDTGVLEMMETENLCNFYAKDNILVNEKTYEKDSFEYDYIYVDPVIRKIGGYYLLINQDGTQAEIITKIGEGVFETVRITHDSNEIERLEFVTSKESMGRMGFQAVETILIETFEHGDTINAYNRSVDRSGLSPTLTTRPEGFKTAILPITKELRIRKLTPLECWRLQGFTDEQFYKAQNSGVSNSQLYKQAGNSVTVTLIYEIVKSFNDYRRS